MSDLSRIEDLQRRVRSDPASIAFAQLAEEYRRAGRFEEAVEICRAGLKLHPGYVSARLTLGRALLALDRPDEAQAELEAVLKTAPRNVAVIRGLGEIHQRRGELVESLDRYRAALSLAYNDPMLEHKVDELAGLARAMQPVRSEVAVPLTVRPETAPVAPVLAETFVPTPVRAEPVVRVPSRAERTIAALEHFLSAAHVARARQPA